MKKSSKVLATSVALLTGVALIVSCGKDDDDDAAPAATTEQQLASGITVVYPSTLALSSPTAASGATALTLAESSVTQETKDSSVAEKQKEIQTTLLAGSADACQPKLAIFKGAQPSCYAADVSVLASSTDTKATASTLITIPTTLVPINNNGQSIRGIRGGDAGIIKSLEGSDACAASAANYYVSQASEKVDFGTELVSKMICAAKVQGKSNPPAVAEKFDLLADVTAVWKLPKGVTVSEATIEGVDTDTYRSFIKISFTSPDGKSHKTAVELTNKPDAADKTNYKGRLVIFDKHDASGDGKEDIVAAFIGYEKSASTINYKFQKGHFHDGADVSKYLSATGFDFKTARSADGVGGVRIDGLTQGYFSLNTTDGTGSMSYAWQAGNNDPATRALVVNVKKETDGSLTGCGIAGYGPSFADETTAAPVGSTMKGFYCGWAQDDTVAGSLMGSYEKAVQKQCFKKNAAGSWEVTSEKLKYSIAKDCGKASGSTVYDLEALATDGKGTADAPIPTPVTPTNVGTVSDKLKTL